MRASIETNGRRSGTTRALAAAAVVVVVSGATASACPTCREALTGADARWARGFSYSIVFLLGALLLVAGTFTFAVWRAVRTRE